jgi:hypothetical protein
MKNKYKTKDINIDGINRTVTLCATLCDITSIFTDDNGNNHEAKNVDIGYTILNPNMDKDNIEIAKKIALGRAIKTPICNISPTIFYKHDKQYVTNAQIEVAFEQCFLHLERHFELYVKVKDLNKIKTIVQ